jgi:hypothetical protein
MTARNDADSNATGTPRLRRTTAYSAGIASTPKMTALARTAKTVLSQIQTVIAAR